jgi:hypothetical protein
MSGLIKFVRNSLGRSREMPPPVSILIPIYQAESLLAEAPRSAPSQYWWPNKEINVVGASEMCGTSAAIQFNPDRIESIRRDRADDFYGQAMVLDALGKNIWSILLKGLGLWMNGDNDSVKWRRGLP